MHMEAQRTPDSQSNPEQKEQNCTATAIKTAWSWRKTGTQASGMEMTLGTCNARQ
jgi:hypothetical protein